MMICPDVSILPVKSIYTMALRWRKNGGGDLLCAAKSRARKDDIYICDTLHYELSVIQKVVIPDKNESKNGLWYWLHGWCTTSNHPDDMRRGVFPTSK